MTNRISYIIPAFNAQDTIAESIRSALTQGVPESEVVVVDDGSTDATFRCASAAADPRVSVVRTANRGVGAARNTGLRTATGEFICFLDADDALAPPFASQMLQAIGPNDAVFCGLEYRSPALEPSGWIHQPVQEDWTLDRLLRFNQLAIGGLLFRRSFLIALDEKHSGAFPQSGLAEDWEFLLRCVSAGASAAPPVQQALYHYRTRPDSRSTAWDPLWSAGIELLTRWNHDRSDLYRREWSLRMLARAACAGRLAFGRRIMSALGSIAPDDLPCLAGALRWTLRRERLCGSSSINPDTTLDTALEMLSILGTEPPLLTQLRTAAVDWATLALSVARRLRPRQVLVIYGYGRNGSDAGRALAAAGIPFSVIDDRPEVAQGLQHVDLRELGPQHVVLVTPDERESILNRLSALPAQVVTPDSSARAGIAA